MVATIVCGLVIIVCIVILILDFTDIIWLVRTEIPFYALVASLMILILSLLIGYKNWGSKEECELEKKTIIYLLETNLNEYSVGLAEDYNRAEHLSNNYWCRFTLREEDLIDIKSYLHNDKEENK